MMAAATPTTSTFCLSSESHSELASMQPFKLGQDVPEAEDVSLSKEEGIITGSEPAATGEAKKWPGWPGESVFRLVVSVLKVGSIIGRKGEYIKKLCEETRARVRILEGAIGTNDRIVLISAKEEKDAEVSPAMDAVLRVFKKVHDMSEGTVDDAELASATSVRLLVASTQAFNLIGKQGTMIKSIQESTSATVRVLSRDELPHYATADERVVEIHGEYLKVLKALEVVLGHLRRFLVDHSILPLFENFLKIPAAQDGAPEASAWGEKALLSSHAGFVGSDYELVPPKRDSLYFNHEFQLDSQLQRSSLSLYRQDHPSLLGRSASTLVTQVRQTMQVPLSYAEEIIGIGGGNIEYIRRSSGAVLTIQETRGAPDEITVEIKGNSSQVQKAQQIIQDFLAGHKERSPYSHLNGGVGYYHSSLSESSSFGAAAGYEFSSGLRAYGSYRL